MLHHDLSASPHYPQLLHRSPPSMRWYQRLHCMISRKLWLPKKTNGMSWIPGCARLNISLSMKLSTAIISAKKDSEISRNISVSSQCSSAVTVCSECHPIRQSWGPRKSECVKSWVRRSQELWWLSLSQYPYNPLRPHSQILLTLLCMNKCLFHFHTELRKPRNSGAFLQRRDRDSNPG